jgi:hypothetical protein
MVKETKLNILLISFICAFGISFGALVLLGLAYMPFELRAPIFVIGALVLSYFFYRIGDISRIIIYSLIGIGIVFFLFPTFMYLGVPKAFPGKEIVISQDQAILISIATGGSALILAIALLKSPFKK